MKRTAMKRSRGNPIHPLLRLELFKRTKGRCEVCGNPITASTMDAHHRKQKSLGGKDHLANLIGCCRLSHSLIHHVNSYSDGRLLRSWEVPGEVPVLLRYSWVLLDDDGGYQRATVPSDGQ